MAPGLAISPLNNWDSRQERLQPGLMAEESYRPTRVPQNTDEPYHIVVSRLHLGQYYQIATTVKEDHVVKSLRLIQKLGSLGVNDGLFREDEVRARLLHSEEIYSMHQSTVLSAYTGAALPSRGHRKRFSVCGCCADVLTNTE